MSEKYENLRKSEVVVAKVLSLLLEAGLKRTTVNFQSLNLDPSFEEFFDTSVNWLINEGIIRANFPPVLAGTGTLMSPVISAYGFSLLGQNIFGSGEKKSNREVISQIASAPTSYAGIGDFIGGLLGGFTKSVNS